MDSTQHLLSEEALVTDWETLSANITTAIEEVNALTAAAKNITFNIQGSDLLGMVENTKKAESAMNNAATATDGLKTSVIDANTATQQFNNSISDVVLKTSNGSKEVRALNSQLQAAQNSFNILSKNVEQNGSALAATATRIQTLKAQIDKLSPSVKIAGDGLKVLAQESVKADSAFKVFGINLDSLLARMTIRMIAFQFLFAPILAGLQALGTEILSLIPGTQTFIDKQKNLQDALVQTADGFTSVIAKSDEFKKSIDNALGDGEEQYQSQINQIKALGIIKGEQYDSELKQFKATQELRDKQIEDLGSLGDKYYKLNQLFSDVDKGGDLNRIRQNIGQLGLSDEDFKKYSQVLDDFLKQRKNNSNLKLYGNPAITAAQAGVDNDTNKIAQQKIDEQTAFESKYNAIIYQKRLELTKQLEGVSEQMRQANEKEDIASVDKIVADTKAKYTLLANDVERNKEAYLKQVTTPETRKGYIDDNIRAYDRLLSLLKQIGQQDKLNQEYELANSQYANSSSIGAGLTKGNADSSKFNAAFGVPDYSKGAKAIDDETIAKKDALQNQFRQLANTITDSTQLIEAEKQLDEKLLEVDKGAYRERLALANDFFNKSAAKITAETADLSSEDSRRHLDNLTSIINGGGSGANQDLKTLYEEQADIKAKANIGLSDVNQKLPGAQVAYDKANSAAQGPLSADYQEEADKQKEIAKKTYDDLLTAKSQYNNDIANADKALLDKEKEYADAIKDALINAFSESAAAIKQIQDNQIAAQQQQLEIKQQQIDLQSKQEIAAIDASTGYAITKDNEKAKVSAQTAAEQNQLQTQANALTLKKAKGDKQYAEMQVILNTSTAIMKAFADFPYPVAIPIAAILAATGALEYAAAASTPLPQFWTGGTTSTNAFSAGERGFELIAPPGKPAYFSTNTASVYNEPIGTQITAHEQTKAMIQQAASNVYANQAGRLKEGNFAKEVAKELSLLIGDRFEDVGNGIQTAVYRSRAVVNINARSGGDRLTYRIGRNK